MEEEAWFEEALIDVSIHQGCQGEETSEPLNRR